MAWQLVPDQISFNAAISAQETNVSNGNPVPVLLFVLFLWAERLNGLESTTFYNG
jgi:hypothetical protein